MQKCSIHIKVSHLTNFWQKIAITKKTISQTSGKEHYKCKQMQIIKSNIEITRRHFTYNNNWRHKNYILSLVTVTSTAIDSQAQ